MSNSRQGISQSATAASILWWCTLLRARWILLGTLPVLVACQSYAADRVQKFSADGDYFLGWGMAGEEPGQFEAPAGLFVDADGMVYVADFYNDRIVVLEVR